MTLLTTLAANRRWVLSTSPLRHLSSSIRLDRNKSAQQKWGCLAEVPLYSCLDSGSGVGQKSLPQMSRLWALGPCSAQRWTAETVWGSEHLKAGFHPGGLWTLPPFLSISLHTDSPPSSAARCWFSRLVPLKHEDLAFHQRQPSWDSAKGTSSVLPLYHAGLMVVDLLRRWSTSRTALLCPCSELVPLTYDEDHCDHWNLQSSRIFLEFDLYQETRISGMISGNRMQVMSF